MLKSSGLDLFVLMAILLGRAVLEVVSFLAILIFW